MIFAADGFSTIDSLVVLAYLAAMLAMGIRIARRNSSTEDFFVGGRSLPAWAVGISLIASLLSTITYLGLPGEMFRTGVGFLTRQLPLPLVLATVWFVWIPFFMRLKLTSAYEYLEHRFDYRTRCVGAVFCILLLLGWISVVVLTASEAMVKIADLDLAWFFGTNTKEFADADMHLLILGVGAFSILYTTLGGLRAVVWTDVVQFFVLVGGAIFTIGTIAYQTDTGLSEWLSYSSEYKHETVEWITFDVSDRSSVLFISVGMMFWTVCTHGANQVALQRYFSVKSVREARKTFLVNAFSSLGLGILLAAVGIALMYFVFNDASVSGDMLQAKNNLDSADIVARSQAQKSVFPLFIRMYLPDGLRGLVVAALFAAAMSTIDSGANSISAIITMDFIRPNSSSARSTKYELRQARFMTGAMGVVVVLSTVGLYHLSKGTNIIDLCQKGFNCFLGPLCALFVLGMFSKRAVPSTVIPAVIIGEIVGVSASYSMELFGKNFSTHLVVPSAFFATIITSFVLSQARRTTGSEGQLKWMWKPIVSQPLGKDG
jgi:solute:Na+ symporter, SSS family